MSLLRLSEWIVVDRSRLNEETRKDYLIVFLLVPLICLSRLICEKVGRFIFLSSNAARELRNKPRALYLAVKKFEESCWKFAYYATVSIYGTLSISWEPFIRDVFDVYPNQVPQKVYWYYMIQLSFYIWMSVCMMWDVRKKDFVQMSLHHATTVVLLVTSYSWQLTNMGSLIMLLMDIADPFLELGKIFKYLGKETPSLISFITFLLSFVGLRVCFYPFLVNYPCLFHTWELAVHMEKEYVYYVLNIALIILLLLNIGWTVLIFNVLIKKLQSGQMQDVRSDDETD